MILTHTTVDLSCISEGRTPRSVVTALPATIYTLVTLKSDFGRDDIESTLAPKFPKGTEPVGVSTTGRVRSSLGTIRVRNPGRDSSIESGSRGCCSRSWYCSYAGWKPRSEVSATVIVGKCVSTGAGRASEVTVTVIGGHIAFFRNAPRFSPELPGKASARWLFVALVHTFAHGVSSLSIGYRRR
jgi:hypothetical protein